tara:strand:+ start:279 stop:563 length:285 start_codon:yes stop_codon:yes gene_type:complete
MNGIKIFLVILVIFVCMINGGSIINKFTPNYPHDFKNIELPDPTRSNLYMCKDENDMPFSCHGQGVSQRLFDIYDNMSYGCPTNWLTPGNSIYR